MLETMQENVIESLVLHSSFDASIKETTMVVRWAGLRQAAFDSIHNDLGTESRTSIHGFARMYESNSLSFPIRYCGFGAQRSNRHRPGGVGGCVQDK